MIFRDHLKIIADFLHFLVKEFYFSVFGSYKKRGVVKHQLFLGVGWNHKFRVKRYELTVAAHLILNLFVRFVIKLDLKSASNSYFTQNPDFSYLFVLNYAYF